MFSMLTIAAAVLVIALLYSTVGHAGASGYLAVFAVAGLPPEQFKPSALLLNILVSTIAAVKFYRAQCVCFRTLISFAAASIPAAFFGGMWHIDARLFKALIAAVLIYAAIRLLWPERRRDGLPVIVHSPALAVSLPCGAAIGLLSGLIGVGGGIFLSPLLILAGWAEPRKAAGISAVFILLNSIAGIIGLTVRHPEQLRNLPVGVIAWAIAAAIGGAIGAHWGSKRLAHVAIKKLLAIVLLFASIILAREATIAPT